MTLPKVINDRMTALQACCSHKLSDHAQVTVASFIAEHLNAIMSLPIIHFTLSKDSRRKLLRKKPRRKISIMPNALFLLTTMLDDSMLPTMDAGELQERIRAMRKQEASHHCCEDYMRESDSFLSVESQTVDEESRIKMVEWCYQVVDFCKFRRETVGIAMSYLDRYLATLEGRVALIDRKFYQLAAMTSLYMAIKIHEPLEMETSLLADLSRGCYTDVQIAEMEIEILNALEWRLAGPTPLAFVQHFMALLKADSRVKAAIMDYARYQTELAVSSLELVPRHSSEIALAAILNALEGIDRSLLPLRSRGAFVRAVERVSGMFVEEVEDIQDTLSEILLDIYPDNPGSDASSSIHWDLLSTADETESYKSMNKSSLSSQTGDGSPVWVGETSYR